VPKLPGSLVQRLTTMHRTMNRNAGGGRSALVAPEPRPLTPPGSPLGDSYDALAPWGVAGDSTWQGHPWYAIFEDAAAAAAQSGGSFDFGINPAGDPSIPVGFAWSRDAQDTSAGYVQFLLGDDFCWLQMYPNSAFWAEYVVEAAQAHWELGGSGVALIEGTATSNNGKVRVTAGPNKVETYADNTNDNAWIVLSASTAPGSFTHLGDGVLFIQINVGTGKYEAVMRLNGTDVVFAVEP
jgi:hypothetical protein